MKKAILLSIILFILLPIQMASASWAYAFVVYSGYTYEVSNEPVPSNEIGKRIGKVTKYSDREGTYRGNFSNIYPKGTPYYSIRNESSKKVIAVQTGEETYIKAIKRGTYSGGMETKKLIWVYVMIGVLAIIAFSVSVMVMRKRR